MKRQGHLTGMRGVSKTNGTCSVILMQRKKSRIREKLEKDLQRKTRTLLFHEFQV